MLIHTWVHPKTVAGHTYSHGYPFWFSDGNDATIHPNYLKLHVSAVGTVSHTFFGIQTGHGLPFFVTDGEKMNEIECQGTGDATCYFYGTTTGTPPTWAASTFPDYAHFFNY